MALSRGDVAYVYNTYLGRAPDENDYKNLVGQNINRAGLTDTVRQSDEYRSLTPEDHIARQFQSVLGRPPSETELSKVMATDDFFEFSRRPMGGATTERIGFNPDQFRRQLSQLPEANLVRVFKNYLGRMPDEEAYRNYLNPLERQFETTGMGTRKNLAESIVDVNYDYAMDPKRLDEVGWSPEAQEYINKKFDAQARAYAAEKGIELPEDFASLAQLRNPWQDNRAGLEGLNLMTPIEYVSKPMGLGEQPNQFDIFSDSERYELPAYAMWNTQAGTAAFSDEEKAREMVSKWGPQAAVDAYARNPADFVKQAAAGVYVNNWIEQNTDPEVTQSGGNADKLAGLGQKYQDLSKRAVDLGANPDDIAQYTSDRVGQVANTFAEYKEDTTPMGFGQFLLLAGGLYLGAMALSSLAAGAGASSVAGSGLKVAAGQGLAPGIGASIGAGATPIGAGSVGLTAGAGAGLAPGIGTSLGAGAGAIGAGSVGLQAPAGALTPTFPVVGGTDLLGQGLKMPTPTQPGASGVGNIKVPAGQGLAPNVGSKVGAGAQQIGTGSVGLKFPGVTPPPGSLSSFVNKAKDVLETASDLSDVLGGGQQSRQQQQQNRFGVPIYRNPAELFPVTNTMMSPEEIMARRTSKPTFVGGLEAIRNLT
jgi:hypothetical protein